MLVKKRMVIMLMIVGLLFGLIFGWKVVKFMMIKRYLATMKSPAVTVSTMIVDYSAWQQKIKSIGSIRAIVGVNVTTELAGMVQKIYFKPGSDVTVGEALVQLNANSEKGQLESLKAQVELAKITYQRDRAQFAAHAVSKQTVDTDQWTLKNLEGQVMQQTATVDKKTIRAPFSGRLGISNINPGQYLNVGDNVTTLQTLDPIYVDFYLPQQALSQLKLNQQVHVTVDTYPNESFIGKITTIEPAVDIATRNVLVEATIVNSKKQLTPGMFTTVNVDVGNPTPYLTVPQSAISFNPYGDIVYIVKKSNERDSQGEPLLTVMQVFVTLGDTRGDQITVLKGLKAGDLIVTSGQLKLKNGSVVVINNTIQPSDQSDPHIVER
jgi:membrane fusion protein (multidrug efflux system)